LMFSGLCAMARYLFTSVALIASPTAAALFPDCINGPLAKNTVCDSSASVSDRARAFVNELTTVEKFNLTGNASPGVPRLGIYP
jgi:xylan 1,4-beta-xylosidase